MSKLQIVYNAESEIAQIIKDVENYRDMKKDEKEIIDVIQKIIQCAFDEGRRFQKQISTNSPTKDSVMVKADI